MLKILSNLRVNFYVYSIFQFSKKLYLLFSKSCLLFPHYSQIDEMNIKLFMNVKQKTHDYKHLAAVVYIIN